MKDLPQNIGPYKIIKKLGEGGFATVYLAHPKDQDETHTVALKVLNSKENYGRFLREVETVAKLKHPNIIRIFDTGEDENTQTPFFSMEYIPSGTLFDRLENDNRLPRAEAVEIIRQIGLALTYPHQQGIIHRDVNPKNILLDTRQKPHRPVLTDFGLVKSLGPDGAKLTETVALIGTFAYYAPEQWNREDLGPATDVYALAITFYEMLAGQRPFGGDVFSLREKHLYEPLPPLSEVAPEIGPFFDQVLIQATAKNPGDRYQTVASFIKDIEEANQQAEQAEQEARRARAIKAIKEAQARTQTNSYEPAQILDTIESALKDYPDYGEALALRGQIKLAQQQYLEALPDFERAYAQQPNPASPIGIGYLQSLKQSAQKQWQRQNTPQALKHYQTLRQILDEGESKNLPMQPWQQTWSQLVQSHYQAGVQAFDAGALQNTEQAITALQNQISALAALNAPTERQQLQNKLRALQTTKHYQAGLAAYNSGRPADITQAIDTLQHHLDTLTTLEAHDERRDLQNKLATLQAKEQKYEEILSLVQTGQYPQALAQLEQNFISTGNYEYQDVARLFWQLIYAKKHNGQLPEDPAANAAFRQKTTRQFEFNRYLIPLSMLAALITGGLIAPQLQNLPGLMVITVIAWTLFIAYFGYYVWVYYLQK